MLRRRRLWRRIGFGSLPVFRPVLASQSFDVSKVLPINLCILYLQIGSRVYELKAVEFILLVLVKHRYLKYCKQSAHNGNHWKKLINAKRRRSHDRWLIIQDGLLASHEAQRKKTKRDAEKRDIDLIRRNRSTAEKPRDQFVRGENFIKSKEREYKLGRENRPTPSSLQAYSH